MGDNGGGTGRAVRGLVGAGLMEKELGVRDDHRGTKLIPVSVCALRCRGQGRPDQAKECTQGGRERRWRPYARISVFRHDPGMAIQSEPDLRNVACAALLTVLALLSAPTVSAQVPGIIDGDDREIMSSSNWPWNAIGRINRSGQGHCTGILIAPARVLTVAHCLYDTRLRRWPPPSALHFLAGYSRDHWAAHRRGANLIVDARYAPETPPDVRSAATDWAILELTSPIDIPPVSVSSQERVDIPVIRAGYSQDRAHVLTVDRSCRILGRLQDTDVLIHNCDGTWGDSGSPLLSARNGALRVTAIHVGWSELDGQTVGIAVPASSLGRIVSSTSVSGP